MVYIVFRLIWGSPTSYKDMASFWDQIPLQMAKKSPKMPNIGQTIGKKTHLYIKNKK